MNTRIAVAMSGGVDSSVAAALLKERGFDLVGVTLKIWDESRCCSLSDADDARKVADLLGIPHYVLDAREAFETGIINPALKDYSQGLTPNPCVLCNRRLKFSWLLDRVALWGCAKVATGHYARIDATGDTPRLLRGLDHAKDQSYFVVPESTAILDKLLFPLGDFHKEEIREMALVRGFSVAQKPDSQDLCFLPPGGLGEFLSLNLGPDKGGEVVDNKGRLLGTHKGLRRYTLGQRKGLGVAAKTPLYVVKRDFANSRVVLGPKEEASKIRFPLRNLDTLSATPLEEKSSLAVRIRSTGGITPCRLRRDGQSWEVVLSEPLFAVTPGQLAVFYDGEVVVGSGWIEADPVNNPSNG